MHGARLVKEIFNPTSSIARGRDAYDERESRKHVIMHVIMSSCMSLSDKKKLSLFNMLVIMGFLQRGVYHMTCQLRERGQMWVLHTATNSKREGEGDVCFRHQS